MLKFSAIVLLFGVAVFWSSAQRATAHPEPKLGIFKREANDGESRYKPSLFLAIGLRLALVNGVDPAKWPIVEEKINEAAEREWKDENEFFDYCFNAYLQEGGNEDFMKIIKESLTKKADSSM